jgi:hypothetical protein
MIAWVRRDSGRPRNMDRKVIRELEALLGRDAVLSSKEDLQLYEYDGSVEQARPRSRAFPRSMACR